MSDEEITRGDATLVTGAKAAASPHPQLVRERQDKSDRLAAALRANLKRRKQQGRARSASDAPEGN